MRDFVIMTDSCCDLTAEMASSLELHVLPLSFHMDEQDHKNLLDGSDMDFHMFYGCLRSGSLSTTSAVSVGDMETAMRSVLDSGRDILYIAFSSGLSATCQSALIAAGELKNEYPDASIRVVDSLAASMGQGLLIYHCVHYKRQGHTLDEVADYAENNKLHLCHWFTVDDLQFLKRGGRINAATALIGTALSIKPVLHVDDAGHLVQVRKVRGRKASLLALVDELEKTAQIDPKDQTIFISHGDCPNDVQFVADEIRRRFGTQDIHINFVGPVIGSHSGPGTVALFFLGQHR